MQKTRNLCKLYNHVRFRIHNTNRIDCKEKLHTIPSSRLEMRECLSQPSILKRNISFGRTMCTNSNDARGNQESNQHPVDDADSFGVLDERFCEKFPAKWPDIIKRNSRTRVTKASNSNKEKTKNDLMLSNSETDSYREIFTKRNKENFENSPRKKMSKTPYGKGTSNKFRNQSPPPWDTFGTLSEENKYQQESEYSFIPAETGRIETEGSDGDKDDFQRVLPFREGKKMNIYQYEDKIMQLIKEHKLKEALEVYHVQMLKEDFVKPNKRIYNLLINACGKVGFTKMAFRLYRKMTDFGIQPSDSTFTGLFNSCANSPWPEDGFRRAIQLRRKMDEKGVIPNTIHYHTMIKAFGKCGALLPAFEIADEMIAKKYAISNETMAFLLMACVQNKEAGFRFAIEVWRKFQKKRIPPSVYTYNLLLRIVRDCGAGKADQTNDLLVSGPTPKTPFSLPSSPLTRSETVVNNVSADSVNNLSAENTNEEDSHQAKQLEFVDRSLVFTRNSTDSLQPALPDLLSYKVQPGNVISLGQLDSAESRLMALGGMQGFLSRMVRDRIKPDIKTFMLLLECIPSTKEAEVGLLSALDQHRVKPDVDFFNILIKRRNMRNDLESAKEVLEMIQQRSLKADIVTYGVMALGCKRRADGYEFLKDMKNAGICPNVEIMDTLLRQALYRQDWYYCMHLIKEMKEEDVQPTVKMLDAIEKTLDKARKTIIQSERGEEVNIFYKIDDYKKGYRKFLDFYNDWLKEMPLDHSDDPWESYRPALKTIEETRVTLKD